MQNTQTLQIPAWFWLISVFALIWNLMGVAAFISQVTISPEALEALTEVERHRLTTTPAWAVGAFGVAVFAGALGSVLLLLRNKLATPVFWVSLAAVVVQMAQAFLMVDSSDSFGPGELSMPVMIIIMAVLLIWFSKSATSRGWLK